MKTLVRIFSIYFLLLLAIPTFKVVKSELGMNCAKSCCNQSKNEKQKGCQKEKCILNCSFNTGQFVVAQIQNISFKIPLKIGHENDLMYEKKNIPVYQDLIWQPPETIIFT